MNIESGDRCHLAAVAVAGNTTPAEASCHELFYQKAASA